MKLTFRDGRLLRDMALSHVLSRDQTIGLGYFRSVTRANTRLRALAAERLVTKIETPFFGQGLYIAGPAALEVVGPNVAPLLRSRAESPRFLRHALTVTNARIALLGRGAESWRFEQQLWARASVGGESIEVRPDGMAVFPGGKGLAVEVDMGHASAAKFRSKLAALDAFVSSGEAARRWGCAEIRLLTLTTGEGRARSLSGLTPSTCSFFHDCRPFAALDLPSVGSWS